MDFSLSSYLEQFYKRIIQSLYDPMRLHRLQDNPLLSTQKTLTLSDFLAELHSAVWQEIIEGKSVSAYRRILQQQYLARVGQFVLKPSPPLPDDAVTLFRYQLRQLGNDIADYLAKSPGLDLMTRAHLENCSDLIADTLRAGHVKTSEQ